MGIGIVFIILILILGLLYRSELKKTEKLQQEQKQLLTTIENKDKVISQLETERKNLDLLLKQRMQQYQQIERNAKNKLTKLQQQLNQLRRQNVKVEEFLSMPLPTAFIDWLREQDNNTERDSQSISTRKPVDNKHNTK